MPFHHVALATRDLDATRRFYTEAMGFPLVKVEAAATLEQTGWARHVFFDTGGGQLFAVWDLHDDTIPDFDPAISRGLGLPTWVNHIAFSAASLDDLAARRQRLDVIEIDHGWCMSIYANDPGGTLVEFCCTTRAFTQADVDEAQALVEAEQPSLGESPKFEIYEAESA
jgi:catechol 2,3-dioxygenase-like lactoylglutathione lyase family enzyme